MINNYQKKVSFNYTNKIKNASFKKSSLTISQNNENSLVNITSKKIYYHKIFNLFTSPPSILGFKYDIENILNELYIPKYQLFQIVLECLYKINRNEEEIKLITSYLFLMQGLTTLLYKSIESELKESSILNHLLILGEKISLEKILKNSIIMRFGDKGSKAYVNLNGSVAILVKQPTKMDVTEEEYLYYLTNLIRYQEYGLINIIINENFKIFPIDIIDDISENNIIYKRPISSHHGKESDKFEERQKTKLSTQINHCKSTKIIERNLVKSTVKNNKNSKIKLNATNEEYKKIFTVYKVNASFLMKKYNLSTISRKALNKCTVEEYIHRLNVITQTNNDIKNKNKIKKQNEYFSLDEPEERNTYNLKIYSYIHVATLPIGSIFGEMALSTKNSTRNATIIALENCYLGVLNKNLYINSLKIGADKNLRDTLNFIVELPLFRTIQPAIFYNKYFTSISRHNIENCQNILTEGENPDYIILLKTGEYSVTAHCSLYDISKLMYYFIYINKDMKNRQSQLQYYYNLIKDTEKLLNENTKFKKFYFTKSLCKITDIICPDIAGGVGFIDEDGKLAFSLQSRTPKGEYFKLSSSFLEKLTKMNETIRNNRNNLFANKLTIMSERLYNIRMKLINEFFEYNNLNKEIGNIIFDEIDHDKIELLQKKRGKRCLKFHSIDNKVKDFFNGENTKTKKILLRKQPILKFKNCEPEKSSSRFIEKYFKTENNKHVLDFIDSNKIKKDNFSTNYLNKKYQKEITNLMNVNNIFNKNNLNDNKKEEFIVLNNLIWEKIENKIQLPNKDDIKNTPENFLFKKKITKSQDYLRNLKQMLFYRNKYTSLTKFNKFIINSKKNFLNEELSLKLKLSNKKNKNKNKNSKDGNSLDYKALTTRNNTRNNNEEFFDGYSTERNFYHKNVINKRIKQFFGKK